MQHIEYQKLSWLAASAPGVSKADIVRNTVGGGLAFWCVAQGAGFSHHSHLGYEYIYVVSGKMDFSGVMLGQGDFLLTEAGEEHGAVALEDAVILVINERKNN